MSHSFDHWADTDAALEDALEWSVDRDDLPLFISDRQLLERFLATPAAADAYARWQDDLIADHADRQQEERRDR